ncbi:MAG: histidine phosphatase family protein [Rhizobiaceae bacterium]|nr:histidine phosphatase family protein [Rhizobiaceae bacterium]
MLKRLLVLAALCLMPYLYGAFQANATEATWARLATGGYTILMTHANAPGVGDPPYFDLEDCTTQRNLSDRGRQLARRYSVRFAARSISISRVYASRWCRTLETASNTFPNVEAEPLEALDLVDDDPAVLAAHMETLTQLIRQFRGPGNQVMITHPEIVEALTGVVPREGEALVVTTARSKDPDASAIDVVASQLLN